MLDSWFVAHMGAILVNPYGAALAGAIMVVLLYQLWRLFEMARKLRC